MYLEGFPNNVYFSKIKSHVLMRFCLKQISDQDYLTNDFQILLMQKTTLKTKRYSHTMC